MTSFCILSTKTKGDAVFSNEKIEPNVLINTYLTYIPQNVGRKLIEDVWETLLCRFVNHNDNPNTYMLKKNGVVNLYSNCIINIGDEIVSDYREVEKIINVSQGSYYKNSFNQTILTNYGN
jgi:hypothetical protein